MSNYSKLIAAVVGAISGFLVTKFGLPAEWAGPEMQAAITTVLAGVMTYIAPPNA